MADKVVWVKKSRSFDTKTWDYKGGAEKELVGVYKGKNTGVGAYMSNIYHFESDKGLVDVWGTSSLDMLLADCVEGKNYKLVYNGKQKNPKTGRQFHAFDLYEQS